jgi:DNA-binding NtrC family response regulator
MEDERLRVLVVDDDWTITGMLEDILGRTCSVEVAHSVGEARRALQERAFDVLFCDWILDDVPSRGFLGRVAADHPSLRRVLMTGSPGHEWRDLLDGGVVCSALAKPFDLGALWAQLRRC